jgi:cyclic beta-1,2-glucan synthetase
MARRHLPRGYSRELPRLLNGPSAGLPRVYDIVLELISHVDAQIDAGPLSAFIAAYQTVFLETGRVVGHSHHVAPGVD